MYLNRNEEFLKMMDILEKLKSNINNINESFSSADRNKEESFQNKSMSLADFLQKQVLTNIESIKELKKPFLLYIVGPGNYGKSTLINALLHEELIKTTDLPNTWKVDLFIKSNEERIEIVHQDSSKEIKSLDEGIKILEKEEEKYKLSKRKISNKLREYKKINKVELSDLKKYKKRLEDKYLYQSDIVEIKYYINKSGILDDFIIVDTPGLNQILLKDTESRMKKYYLRSDGVIWLVDAQNIISKENNNIIDEIYKIDSLHPNKKNMILAVNKMDIIEKNNSNDIMRIKRDVKKIYKDKFQDIVFISAKDAVKGLMSNEKVLENKSNIRKLLSSIDENFKLVAEESQINSKYQNLQIMKYNIIREINIYKRELYKDLSRYNEAEYELYNKTKNLYDYIMNHLNELKSKVNVMNFDFKLIKENVKSIENICNSNLDKLYNTLYSKSNFSNNTQEKIDLTIYLTKSKYIVEDYRIKEILHREGNTPNIPTEKIFNKFKVKNSKNKLNNEILARSIITKKIENLTEEINYILEDKLSMIRENINHIRNESFKDKYLDYNYLKDHINHLNVIEDILKSLG